MGPARGRVQHVLTLLWGHPGASPEMREMGLHLLSVVTGLVIMGVPRGIYKLIDVKIVMVHTFVGGLGYGWRWEGICVGRGVGRGEEGARLGMQCVCEVTQFPQ